MSSNNSHIAQVIIQLFCFPFIYWILKNPLLIYQKNGNHQSICINAFAIMG